MTKKRLVVTTIAVRLFTQARRIRYSRHVPRHRLRQKFGAVLYDWPRFVRAMSTARGWVRFHNRRERPQTEKARTALRRALGSEVAHDAGRLTNGTGARGEQSDHAATKPRAVVERQLPGLRRFHPGTEVTADQDGLRPLSDTAALAHRIADARSQLDLEDAWARDSAGKCDQRRTRRATRTNPSRRSYRPTCLP